MTHSPLIAGPVAPVLQERVIYALDALESTMQVPESALSPEDVRNDEQYIREHSQFMLSVLIASKPDDIFILDKTFEGQTFLIEWLRKIYGRVGIKMSENIYYALPKEFAVTARAILETEPTIHTVSTICFSYILDAVFPDSVRLAASRHINAKTSLSELADRYGLRVPTTVMCDVAEMTDVYNSKFESFAKPVYVKLDGLGGGAHVVKVTDASTLTEIQNKYPPGQQCIIQEAIPDDYLETIHIYSISDGTVSYEGSRSKMVSNNQWYGNIFSPRLKLSDTQKDALDTAAKAVRQAGYTSDKPLLLGIDAFMNKEDIYITEFNARWLGSSSTEYILRKLGVYGSVDAVAMSDSIGEDDVDRYMKWIERHVYSPSPQNGTSFSVLPLGFSAYVDDGNRLVGCIVFGDFLTFQAEFRQAFSDRSLPLLEQTAEIYKSTARKLAVINGGVT